VQKTYAITGVASGIGAELAQILKAEGHRVIGLDRLETHESLDRFVPLDLSDPAAIARAASAIEEDLDGLANIAGLPPRDGLETQILQVNFLGQRAFTEALVPKIKPDGSILNMASRAGHGWREGIEQVKRLAALRSPDQLANFVRQEGIDATRAYNLSKEAMILWTVAEAEAAVSRGQRINSLSPGGVSGTAVEIAQIAAFVMSPAAHWLKGADIPIDGGMGAFNMSDALGLESLRLGVDQT
jgi:NAD(P)-dependent dehydrogenase (short-subunit alcohol dehydrogenase family)